VQCAAVARRTGKRCRLEALPRERYCRYHQNEAQPQHEDETPMQRDRTFYSDALDEGELGLEIAAALRGVDDEIAVLRMLIRKVAREGDVEATRKAIETLCRALKVQYALEGRAADGLARSLAKVLNEVGNELGMAL